MQATAAAIACATGVANVATLMAPPYDRWAAECSMALEVLVAGRGWKWAVESLIRPQLAPLLEGGGGRLKLLRLLGKLGQLAPEPEDYDAAWLREQRNRTAKKDLPAL